MKNKITNLIVAASIAAILVGCAKKLTTDAVIDIEPKSLKMTGISADDSTRTVIWVDIPWQSSGSTVVITSSRGMLVGGTAIPTGGSTISLPASISTHTSGKWSATVSYIAPLVAVGYDTVTAYIMGLTPQYTDSLFILLNVSPAALITLMCPTPAVTVPYGSTATITGAVTTATGLKVSQGTPIYFSLLLNGLPITSGTTAGTYSLSPNPAYTDGSSNVTTMFNPGTLVADSNVYTVVGAIVVNSAPLKEDSVHIFVGR